MTTGDGQHGRRAGRTCADIWHDLAPWSSLLQTEGHEAADTLCVVLSLCVCCEQ
jgi:hypothetical protein